MKSKLVLTTGEVYLGQNIVLHPPYNYTDTGSEGVCSPGNSNGDAKVDLAGGIARVFWEGVGSGIYPAFGNKWVKIGTTFNVVQGSFPQSSSPATIRFQFRYTGHLSVADPGGNAEAWIYACASGPTGEVQVRHWKIDFVGTQYPSSQEIYDYPVTLQSGNSCLAYMKVKVSVLSILGASMSNFFQDAYGRRLTLESVAILFHNNPPKIPSEPVGATSGETGIPYTYSASTKDPEGDQVKYVFDWGDGTRAETKFVPSGIPGDASHSWPNTGKYSVRVMAIDAKNASSGWSQPLFVSILLPNSPPDTPSEPGGSTHAVVGKPYTYSASTKDPEGDQVKYVFDWGDGTRAETKFVPSGIPGDASHSWPNVGEYSVRVMAIDAKNASSGWSQPLFVSVFKPVKMGGVDIPVTVVDIGEVKLEP
jgi:hypothetical protein